MSEPEQTFSVDIPMAELPGGFTPPIVAKEPKPKPVAKAEPVVAAPVVKDTRDDDLKASREALAQSQADRERLTKELTTERQMLGTAAGVVSDLERENHKRTAQALYARGEAAYSEQQQFVNAIHAAKMEAASAREALETALADDNLDARERAKRIADATERQTLATQDSRQLEFGKSSAEAKLQQAQREFESHMKTRPTAEADPELARREEVKEPVREEKKPAADPFEAYVGQFPKESQEWLRANPDYVKDQRLNKRLQAAALEWDAEGKPLHTNEFVEHLNAKFFPKKEEEVTEEEEDNVEEIDTTPTPPVAKTVAKSAPAAPVSRSTSPARGSDKRSMKVSLTNAEREHAIGLYGPGTKWNLGPEEAMKRYGGRKLQATADGKYEPR